MMMRAGLWAFAGKGGQQVVKFALVIVLARLLTPEAFGIGRGTETCDRHALRRKLKDVPS